MKPTGTAHRSLALACVPAMLVAIAPGATAYEETPTITIEPVWVDGNEFGWGCDSELHEEQTCSKVEGPGLRVGEPGEEAFGKRFSWRSEIKDKETDSGEGKGVCKLWLQAKEPSGLPEKDVITLSVKEIYGVADSRCIWKFSPDGSSIGLAAGWADYDYGPTLWTAPTEDRLRTFRGECGLSGGDLRGKRFLEIGCGLGILTDAAASRLGAEAWAPGSQKWSGMSPALRPNPRKARSTMAVAGPPAGRWAMAAKLVEPTSRPSSRNMAKRPIRFRSQPWTSAR